jgi:hypothetical protein
MIPQLLIPTKYVRDLPRTLAFAAFLAACAPSPSLLAQSELPHPTFRWTRNPTNNDWNTAANWAPAEVPDTSSEAAEFGPSAITDIVTTSTTVHSIEFKPARASTL